MWSKLRKHPLYWHLVAALIAGIVELLLGEARKQHLLKGESFWIATGLVVGGLLISLQIWLYYWNRRRLVFVLLPPFHNNYFFAGLLWNLLEELRERDLVGVPISHTSGRGQAGQNRDFDEILRRKQDYMAGIVAGLEPGVGADEVRHFLAAFGKPVVFVDAEPFQQERDYPPTTAYVGFDDKAGARIAADALLDALPKSCSAPRILVIGGNLKKDRQVAFKQHVKTLRPKATVAVDEDGRFLREEACKIAERYLRNGQVPCDGVFCTNDEMALGALDAMQRLVENGTKPLLVGYDAIPEAVREIEKGTQFKNTVVQETRELAARGSELIADFLEGSRNPLAKVNRLEPVVYKKINLGS